MDGQGAVRGHWRDLERRIHGWSAAGRASISASAARMLADLGTTFNVYSDVGGPGQPFEMDPIPLMVAPADWERVRAGLAQRIHLLERVLADLFGPQELLGEGLIPPDLVHASPAFFQYARGVNPPGGKFLVTCGCELVRPPGGRWMVLRDLTSAPGGLGQVLENRNVTSNLLADDFDGLRIARLAPFFEAERATLEAMLPHRGEEPNVVFLTPGYRHPSYFEHAYKARLLGFPLVEPADLTVRERRLHLKTLAGLRPIDSVVCRLDEARLDPLEHWSPGGGGVPGLVEAWRSGNVALANAPGSGFASSPALLPFLPAICRKWLGEELKLPFVETWWLGQPEIRVHALANLHRYMLVSAFGQDPRLPLRCAALPPAARKRWMAEIAEKPWDFVVQADVAPSIAPSLGPRGIRSRPVVWHAFAVQAADGPAVLPGGMAKVGKTGLPPQLWPAHAGFTKDVWIADDAADFAPRAGSRAPRSFAGRNPAAAEVVSRIAEQLFWVGRYAERVELATRLLRVTLRNFGGETGRRQQQRLGACLALLRSCALVSEEIANQPAPPLETLAALIHDPAAKGGIPNLTRSLVRNAAAARDRLSDDTWRFFNRLESLVHAPAGAPGVTGLLRTLDNLVLHLAAFAGMQSENMTRGQGWRFLEIGRRLERGLACMRLLRAAAAGDSALLDPLLETCDSVMTYRRRHFSQPRLDAVMDLLFYDATNPRSVGFQITILARETDLLPGDSANGLMPSIRRQLEILQTRLADPAPPGAGDFPQLAGALESFADMLTQHYFSHSVRRVY